MATLEGLLKINGVVGAFEFTPDGRLLRCEANMDLSPEVAASGASFCEAVTMLFNTEPDPFAVPGDAGQPGQDAWMAAQVDWVVVTGHNRGVFAEEDRASVEELIEAVTT